MPPCSLAIFSRTGHSAVWGVFRVLKNPGKEAAAHSRASWCSSLTLLCSSIEAVQGSPRNDFKKSKRGLLFGSFFSMFSRLGAEENDQVSYPPGWKYTTYPGFTAWKPNISIASWILPRERMDTPRLVSQTMSIHISRSFRRRAISHRTPGI